MAGGSHQRKAAVAAANKNNDKSGLGIICSPS